MARHASNVTRIRRPLSPRHVIRAVVFVVAFAGGMGLIWMISPHRDYLTTDLTLGYGLVLGLVMAFALSSQIRVDTPAPPVADEPIDEDRHTRLRRQLLGDEADIDVEYPQLP